MQATCLLILLGGSFVAAHEEPAAPVAPANLTAVPAPPQPGLSPPPVIASPTSTSGFLRPNQPAYGPLIPPSPAQNVAMQEAGEPVFPNDPRVRSAAVVLTQLTAMYVEDAPRISELAIRVVGQLRAANQAASPFEMLVGATQW